MTGPTAHQALYRRWRAQTFGQIVGQQAVVTTLRNAVRLGQLSHGLLFVGPRGTGKTSMARIVAKAINCLDLRDGEPCDRCEACISIRDGRALDLIEIDAASNRGINEIRSLRESLPYAPTDLRRKVYILDEAHQITKDAWNALLKSLEEPPEHVVFIFASTEPSGFPAAILSRLQRYDFRPLAVPEIEGKLRTILAADGRNADPDAINLVATLAAGGMRDAESMLDQLLAGGDERLTADHVRDLLGLADADAIAGFLTALAAGDAAEGVRILDRLEDRGRDVRTFLDQLVDAMRTTLVSMSGGAAGGREALLGAARRLAAIDPSRTGPGGLRFQLELVLLDSGGGGSQGSGILNAPAEAAGRRSPARPGERPSGTVEGDRRAAGPAAISDSPATLRKAAGGGPDGQSGAARAPVAAVGGHASARPSDGDGSPGVRPAKAASATTVTSGRSPAAPAEVAPEPSLESAPAAQTAPPHESLADPAVAASPLGSVAPESTGMSADLEQLLRRWPEIVVDIGRKPAVKPLIAACRPIGVEGNIVTLGFPENQAFLRDLLERRRAEIEEGVSRHLGRNVGVRCVATNLDLAPALPADADSSRLLEEFHRIFAGDVADVPDVE